MSNRIMLVWTKIIIIIRVKVKVKVKTRKLIIRMIRKTNHII